MTRDEYREDLAAYERGEPTGGRFPEALRLARERLQDDPGDEELAALVLRVELKLVENIKGIS